MNILSEAMVTMTHQVRSLRLALAGAISRPVVLGLASLAILTGHAVSENAPVQKHQFQDHLAASAHTGKAALADFCGRDRQA